MYGNPMDPYGYNQQMLRYKKKNMKTLRKVYSVALLLTILLAIYTYQTLVHNPLECPGTWLRSSLYLVLVMHGTNMVQQFIAIAKIFDCEGSACDVAFDVYEVLVLIFMQCQLYFAGECDDISDA